MPESDEEKENVGPAAPDDEQLRTELDRKLAEFVEAARVEMRAVSQLVQEDLTSLPQPIGPISMQVGFLSLFHIQFVAKKFYSGKFIVFYIYFN